MANDDEKVDALQGMFHSLDKKVERILVLLDGRKEREDDVDKRLKVVESQTTENTNALRVIKWLGGAAFAVVMVAVTYLVQLGLDTVRQLMTLVHK